MHQATEPVSRGASDIQPIRTDITAQVYRSGAYFPLFDYLRIFLATAVAVGHAGLSGWDYSGSLAVQVFFALSGWLIGGILLHSKPADLPRFYYNRATRIWIPYYAAVFFLIAASLLKEKVTFKWAEFVFYFATFVYNFFGPPQLASHRAEMPLDGTGNHLWSICAEEQFYLFAPLALVLLPRPLARSMWTWALICIAVYISPLAYYFGSISLGILAAISFDRFGHWHLKPVAVVVILTVFLASFFAVTLVSPYQTACAGFVSVTAVLLLARPGRMTPTGSFLGGMSYPMYLNHWIGIFIANAVTKPFELTDTLLAHILSIVLALGIAAVLYICIDRVILARRSGWFSRPRGWLIAFTGFALVFIGLTGGLLLAT